MFPRHQSSHSKMMTGMSNHFRKEWYFGFITILGWARIPSREKSSQISGIFRNTQKKWDPLYPYYSRTTPIFEAPKDTGNLYGSRLPQQGPMSLGVPEKSLNKSTEEGHGVCRIFSSRLSSGHLTGWCLAGIWGVVMLGFLLVRRQYFQVAKLIKIVCEKGCCFPQKQCAFMDPFDLRLCFGKWGGRTPS